MPLPNIHALRTKNIIRSHEMEVEVWQREVEHIACFRQPVSPFLSRSSTKNLQLGME
jgi:hypothetical protein